MSRRRQGIENHLLIASGAAAVALTAIINGIYTDSWPSSLLFAAFLGLFLAAAYDAELELTPRAAALCVYGMAALSSGHGAGKPRRAGTASSLLGFMQQTVGAVLVQFVSVLNNDSPVTLAVFLLVLGLLSVACALTIRGLAARTGERPETA